MFTPSEDGSGGALTGLGGAGLGGGGVFTGTAALGTVASVEFGFGAPAASGLVPFTTTGAGCCTVGDSDL